LAALARSKLRGYPGRAGPWRVLTGPIDRHDHVKNLDINVWAFFLIGAFFCLPVLHPEYFTQVVPIYACPSVDVSTPYRVSLLATSTQLYGAATENGKWCFSRL